MTPQAMIDFLNLLSDEPLLVAEATGGLKFANAAAYTLFGPYLNSQPLNHFIRHPDFDLTLRQVARDRTPTDMVYVRPGVPNKEFKIRCLPFDQSDVLLVFNDLTQAHVNEKIRTDFIANVSHELRSPLTAIVGFIETLMDNAQDDPDVVQKFLPIMRDEAARMQRLIAELLALSRIEHDEAVPPKAPVPILNIIHQAIDSFAHRAQGKGSAIELINELPQDYAPQVKGEHDALLEVFHNLLENAVNYGYADRDITVHVTFSEPLAAGVGPGNIRISIINWGDGIAPEHLARVTERFYRVDKSRSRALGGSGLGLAIVKHIVRWHQGRLIINSEPERQTSFTISLPLVK